MHTHSPATGDIPPSDGQPGRRAFPWPKVRYVAPVVLIAMYGALWIALHAKGGRGSTHALFQSLALAETVVALLLRRRKPVGALAGTLAVYMLFELDPLLLPAVLFALFTVATIRDHRTVAIAAAATAAGTALWPYIHGHAGSFAGYSLPRLAAAGAAAGAGLYLQTRRNGRAATPAERPADEHASAAATLAGERGAGEPHGQPRTLPPAKTSHAAPGPARPASTATAPSGEHGAGRTQGGDQHDSYRD